LPTQAPAAAGSFTVLGLPVLHDCTARDNPLAKSGASAHDNIVVGLPGGAFWCRRELFLHAITPATGIHP
jgi:hypothetical protein